MEYRIWAAILVASLGWGTGSVASRAALGLGMSPYGLAFARSALATAAVYLFLVLGGAGLPRRRDLWGHGLVLGLANLAGPFLFFTLAVQYVSAGFASVLVALIPATTAVLAHFLLPDEPFRAGKLVGLSVAFGGVALLLLSGQSGIGTGGRPLLGGVLCLVGVVLASYGGVYSRRHAARHGILEMTGPQFVVGALALGAVALASEGSALGPVPLPGWALVAYLALASSFLPFVLFFWMVQRISATRASLVGYVIPIVGVVAGAVLLGEQVTSSIVLGGALILAGVVLVNRSDRRPIPATTAT